MIRYILIAVGCAMIVGCCAEPPFPEQERAEKQLRWRKFKLPPAAENIVELGNSWITFDLDVGGRKRTFLFRDGGSASTNTELSK